MIDPDDVDRAAEARENDPNHECCGHCLAGEEFPCCNAYGEAERQLSVDAVGEK